MELGHVIIMAAAPWFVLMAVWLHDVLEARRDA